MKHRKLISIALALLLALSLCTPAFAAEGDTLTRGEFVSALFALSGVTDIAADRADFTDVPADSTLAPAIRWAVGEGIVKGYGNGKFGPDDPVTREQMATMLYRYAQVLGQGFQGMWYFLLDYPDAGRISDWADEAMHWCVMNGIIVGTDKGLEPKATATDDQLAIVLERWQNSLAGTTADTGDGVWYSFPDIMLAMKVPEDMEFQVVSDGIDLYIARNDRLLITLSRWDQIGGPELEDLAALAAESTMEPTEIVERGGLMMVKANRADREINYFLMAPDGDSYSLWISPNKDAHPELTVDDVAEEARAVEESLCHVINVPWDVAPIELSIEHDEIDYLVLVNKTNSLPADWEENLELVWTVNSLGDTVEVERSAYKAYLALKADLRDTYDIYVELDSAYRSVAAQQEIWDKFLAEYGEAYTKQTVAVPGTSEHHTGLALDLYFRVKSEDGTFKDVYKNEDMEQEQYLELWAAIHEKLADYGFILRYPEGKEDVTGYRYEPWHIRFVGTPDVSYPIMERGLTLEEYLGIEDALEAQHSAWSVEGYFSDESGNVLSITWMDDIDEPGWYVGCMLGETMAGGTVKAEDHVLHGDLNAWDDSAEPFIVTITEEGEDGLKLVVEGGETYHFTPMDLPEATIFVTIDTEGWGNIDYAEGEEAPEIDPEFPYQYAQINLAEPATYTFAAWADAGYLFVKWTKDGEDFSTEPVITVLLDESAVFVAVFEEDPDWQNPVMNFIGEYQCDRAHALVQCFGKEDAWITIEWGSSAWELARWDIIGHLDLDTLTIEYTGCTKMIVVYNEDGEIESQEPAYEDGSGTIVFHNDGTFTWHEDQSEYGTDMVFQWIPVTD